MLTAIDVGLLVGWIHGDSEGGQLLECLVGDLVGHLAVGLVLLAFVVLGIELEGAAGVHARADELKGTVAEVALGGFKLEVHAFSIHGITQIAHCAVASGD